MINIVIVSHADLAGALIRAAEMIAGPQEGLFAVALAPGDSPESLGDKLSEAIAGIRAQEMLVLIDLFGGTPYNVAVSRLLREPTVECVTGANLPMLLELLMARDGATLAELAADITQAGQDSVKNLGPMLKRRTKDG